MTQWYTDKLQLCPLSIWKLEPVSSQHKLKYVTQWLSFNSICNFTNSLTSNKEYKANYPHFPVNKNSVATSLIHIKFYPLLSPCLLLYHTCLKVSLVSWIFSIMTKISSPVLWAFSYKQNKISSATSLTYMYHTHKNSCRYILFYRHHLGNDC